MLKPLLLLEMPKTIFFFSFNFLCMTKYCFLEFVENIKDSAFSARTRILITFIVKKEILTKTNVFGYR